ncbi:hypothetical protein AL755_19370 [Arthrobacter sp. ERGS1:01]|uniref:vWA domain-containing protein n=1 Tax=Arthrobacter sp. ERGS1:01 TaxID=1704044 RepID=UPI0006B55BFC|nr:vWA domain-containing protein [Arthrobacter sp. ERGS1:01]ALE07127.1 hypothetical protein AL755_19370 [Arthrobacter sp. ERGS1:01]
MGALPAIAAPAPTKAAAAAPTVSPNPALPQRCGLNLAMVFDLSNSMSDDDIASVKKSSSQAVAALQGTGTSMGVYSFGTFATANLGATSLASAQGATAVTSAINGLIRPGDSNKMLGGTNWQQALAIVPAKAYDGVIFFTDGRPTFFGAAPLNANQSKTSGNGGTGSDDTSGTGANVAAALDAAIPEANKLKDAGTRVIGVGVKDADAARLAQITGPVAGSDYYTTNYDQLAATLKAIATAGCQSTLNVNKAVQAFDSTDTTPGAGWVFDATPANAPAVALTTGANGQAGMNLDFTSKQPVAVTIKERQLPGYAVVQNAGFNAVCTRDGAPLAVTNTNDAGNTGFTVTALASTVTSCTVTNKAPLKAWTMSKTSDARGTVNPGDTISYTVDAVNTGVQAVDGISFRDDLSGVLSHARFVPGSATLSVAGGTPVAVADPAAAILTAGPMTLGKGQGARLSYQVVVNDDAFGATLSNAVTGTGSIPPASCTAEAPCTTTDVTPPKPVEPTPTPTPTVEPSVDPTPTVEPTTDATPTPTPSVEPTTGPTPTPSVEPTTDPTPTPTTDATSTTSPTPTADPTPTPTTDATSTSSPTTSIPPTASGTSTTAPTASNPSPTVKGTKVASGAPQTAKPTEAATGDLAYTGASSALPLAVGGLLLASGCVLVMVRRSRRAH